MWQLTGTLLTLICSWLDSNFVECHVTCLWPINRTRHDATVARGLSICAIWKSHTCKCAICNCKCRTYSRKWYRNCADWQIAHNTSIRRLLCEWMNERMNVCVVRLQRSYRDDSPSSDNDTQIHSEVFTILLVAVTSSSSSSSSNNSYARCVLCNTQYRCIVLVFASTGYHTKFTPFCFSRPRDLVILIFIS